MNLDARTLLFALILTNGLMVLSLYVAKSGSDANGKREGIGKWATAMLLETLAWSLIAARSAIPDVLSIIVANGLIAGAHALWLAAICEFQRRPLPRWQYAVPIALALLMTAVLVDDMHGRVIWGSLIYGFQMTLIAHTLWSDPETRAGRAWRLLFGGTCLILLLLGLRALAALSGKVEFAQPVGAVAPNPLQIVLFVAVMASALLGSIGFVLMVKERADREILHLAMTDSLTGVPNRRALIDHVERALARRSGLPLALLMIDVDHFKWINDTQGHPAGDEVLRKVADLFAARLRRQDMLARYGGEEFCVLAPDTDAGGALILADSLREAIANTPIETRRGKLHVTVSIGGTVCRANNTSELKDILAEADAALYRAKQDGRNRTHFCEGLPVSTDSMETANENLTAAKRAG